MNKGKASHKSPGRHVIHGPAYKDGSPKRDQSESGLKKSTVKPVPVMTWQPTGSHLPGIFHGLFTLKGSGNRSPTQNVYVIKTDGLIIVALLELTFYQWRIE
jgi:hypothetical protein